jgi:3-mercaptopyruvate sulfurtransferase SseA
MRKLFLTAALAACASVVVLLAACKADDHAGNLNAGATAPPPSAATADGARRVTIVELQKMLANKEAVVYDVRPKEQYDQGHIEGSGSLPSGEAANRAGELPKDKLIVLYCA